MQRISLAATCLLACLLAGKATATLAAVAQAIEKPATYITETNLHCGDLDANVETFCEPDERLDAACFLQKLKLKHQKSGKETTKLYLYEKFREDQSLVTALQCVKGRDENMLVLRATNLGNCKECEWSDYFSPEGAYLGSDRTMFGPTNIKIKPVPDSLLKKSGYVFDGEGHFINIDDVHVMRKLREEK